MCVCVCVDAVVVLCVRVLQEGRVSQETMAVQDNLERMAGRAYLELMDNPELM